MTDNIIITNIMSAIIDNNEELVNNIREIYSVAPPHKVRDLIAKHFIPTQEEKKGNAEFPTPVSLVNEMLDKIPLDFWKTPKNVFEPCCGKGNFVLGIFDRFWEGLKEEIEDEADRCRVILSCIHFADISTLNVFITTELMKCHFQNYCGIEPDVLVKSYVGDTLTIDIHTTWGISNFDAVIGNPPYHKGGIRSHTGKQLGEKNETIWPLFVNKSFEWLIPNGWLLFITPLSWLKKSHSIHNEMVEKYIVWLKLWDDSQSKGAINADIPISLYVLQNTLNKQNKKTEIISEIKRKKLTTTSFEYLNKNYSIPLAFHSIFDKLIQFIEKHNCSLEYKTKTIKSSGTKAKIPTDYTLEDMWAIDTYTLNEGILVKKATEQHPDANKRKLIIANKRGFKGAFIDEGKLSLTGNHKFYILGDNLELILKIMNFGISNILCDYTKYRMSFLEKEVCNYIPDIRKLGIADITEDEFYKLIGLTTQDFWDY